MVTATLSKSASSIKQPAQDEVLRNQGHAGRSVAAEHQPAMIVTLGLSGITDLRFIADESSDEEILRRALMTVHPILEMLRQALASLQIVPHRSEN